MSKTCLRLKKNAWMPLWKAVKNRLGTFIVGNFFLLIEEIIIIYVTIFLEN